MLFSHLKCDILDIFSQIERRSPSYMHHFCKHKHAKQATFLSFTQHMKYLVVLGWVFILDDIQNVCHELSSSPLPSRVKNIAHKLLLYIAFVTNINFWRTQPLLSLTPVQTLIDGCSPQRTVQRYSQDEVYQLIEPQKATWDQCVKTQSGGRQRNMC